MEAPGPKFPTLPTVSQVPRMRGSLPMGSKSPHWNTGPAPRLQQLGATSCLEVKPSNRMKNHGTRWPFPKLNSVSNDATNFSRHLRFLGLPRRKLHGARTPEDGTHRMGGPKERRSTTFRLERQVHPRP